MFENLLGQERVKQLLNGWANRDRWPNAALFYGPQRVGKFVAAVNTAQLINCKGQKTSICMCKSCKKIKNDPSCHPDVHFIRPNEQDNITIDLIRALEQSLAYCLNEGVRKVAVIKDAHRLLPGAGNALLKLLEEPAGDTTIILTTNRIGYILDTIKSRSHMVRFSFLPDQAIADLLIRDVMSPDPVMINMLGGSYSLSTVPEGLIVFKKFWEGETLVTLDESGGKALRSELVYLAGCISYMYHEGISEFQGVKVIRLNAGKVNNFITMVDQALTLFDGGVRPFLVAKFFEKHAKEVLAA